MEKQEELSTSIQNVDSQVFLALICRQHCVTAQVGGAADAPSYLSYDNPTTFVNEQIDCKWNCMVHNMTPYIVTLGTSDRSSICLYKMGGYGGGGDT